MKRGTEVGLGPGHIVLDGDPAHLSFPKWAQPPPPRFSAHVGCGQTAAWMKMPLDREVGLGPDDIVLDGDRASPPPKRGHSPQFSTHVYCGHTAGWIKMPLGTKLGLGPGHIVLDWDPARPPNI